MDKNEVAVKQDHPVSLSKELGFDYRSNFDGGATPRLADITIVHAGQVFKNKTGTFAKFLGNIIHYHRSNVLWLEDFEGTKGTPPDCASLDAITPTQGENIQSPKCAVCPQNEWGSNNKDGKGKRCRNVIRCHILMDGDILPTRLTIPPTSLKPFDEFISGLYNEQIPYQLAKVEFSLIESSSGAKGGFSRISLKMTEIDGSDERMRELKSYIDKFKISFGEAITQDEVQQ